MKLTTAEVLRRAIADAARAAGNANTAAWRAQRKLLAAKEAAAAFARDGSVETIGAFAVAETTRQHALACETEGQTWEVHCAVGQLAGLLGVKES